MAEKFKECCIAGRDTLPALPCNYEQCPWYVHNDEYANCFWVVAEVIYLQGGSTFSEDEIALFEGISEQEVKQVLSEVFKKIRTDIRHFPMLLDEL